MELTYDQAKELFFTIKTRSLDLAIPRFVRDIYSHINYSMLFAIKFSMDRKAYAESLMIHNWNQDITELRLSENATCIHKYSLAEGIAFNLTIRSHLQKHFKSKAKSSIPCKDLDSLSYEVTMLSELPNVFMIPKNIDPIKSIGQCMNEAMEIFMPLMPGKIRMHNCRNWKALNAPSSRLDKSLVLTVAPESEYLIVILDELTHGIPTDTEQMSEEARQLHDQINIPF